MKDKVTRESKGVAFVLFVERASAHRAIQALNRKELFGRTLKVSIAVDNGRTKEFIKRKVYRDKSRCYECGETGHLSYRSEQLIFAFLLTVHMYCHSFSGIAWEHCFLCL